jgi:anti-sigma regulatory factor (Ser/Thr protein kinase)
MATSPVEPLRLDPLAAAVSAARRYVRDTLHRLHRTDVLDAAELAASELTTNACLHARTPFEIRVVVRDDGRVRIEVSDDSPRAPHRRRHNLDATTGRGLELLSAIGEWGVAERPGGKTVWFEPRAEVNALAY